MMQSGFEGIHAQSLAAETATPQSTQAETGDSHHKSVIIDPGHGGNDKGAQLGGGETEKKLTLALSEMLQRQLSGNYRVVLTRTDDIDLTVTARSAQANQAHGDLFISFHVAGKFVSGPGSVITIFHAQAPSRSPQYPSQRQFLNSASRLTPWFQAQHPHLPESQRLAQFLVHQLSSDLPSWKIYLNSSSIAVLDGAQMPAVLMEIDPPNSPEGIQLGVPSPWLNDMIRSVAKTIESFWSRGDNGPIIQDLHE